MSEDEGQGARIKLSRNDDGRLGGIIQYLPIERSNADALFVDDKQVATGPLLSYDRIYKLIAKRLRKLPA